MLSLKLTLVTFLVLTITMVSAFDRSTKKSYTRAPCYENKVGYQIPPERVGVKDRLCLGCGNYPSVLKRGENLTSASGQFVLRMEPDNNLVLYSLERGELGSKKSTVWHTDTSDLIDAGNFSVVLEEDGLVKLSVDTDRTDTIWCNKQSARVPEEGGQANRRQVHARRKSGCFE
jgi:hypothetical protein